MTAYKLSRKAEDDIIHLYQEGVRLFGQTQADLYYDKLFETFDLLAHNPKIARIRRETKPPVRIHPFESHAIIYVIDEYGDILIIRVRHKFEDWARNPV